MLWWRGEFKSLRYLRIRKTEAGTRPRGWESDEGDGDDGFWQDSQHGVSSGPTIKSMLVISTCNIYKKYQPFLHFVLTSVLSQILQDFKALCGAEVFPDLPAEQIVVIFNGLECKEDQKVNYTSKVNMVIDS